MKSWKFVGAALAAILNAHGPACGAEDPGERRAAIERTAELLESNYVYPDRGRKLGKQLRREARAAWVSAGSPEEFAEALTERLRGLSADGHFHVDFRQDGADATEETAFGAAEFRTIGRCRAP